jgi:hypothetical protein
MTTVSEYRQSVEESFGWAENAKTAAEKEALLDMGQAWIKAAAKMPPRPGNRRASGAPRLPSSASACALSGAQCSALAFMRGPGIIQVLPSISAQVASSVSVVLCGRQDRRQLECRGGLAMIVE